MENSFDLDPRAAEVDEEAELKACRAWVVEALSLVNFVEAIAGFQLDDKNIFDQQVCKVFADDNAVVNNIKRLLDLDLQPELFSS